MTALGFLTGTVFGISVIVILSFTSGPGNPGSGITPISPADAHTYCKNYFSTTEAFNQVIKGFTLDRSQFEAMNSLVRENSTLTGFRVYFGKDSNSKKVGIVVGIDSNGKDAVNNTIYNTSSPTLDPCPPICDVSSPIIKE